MSPTDVLDAAHATAVPAAAERKAAVMQMLDGDEVVQLTSKPSPWYVAFASFGTVAAMALVATAAAVIGSTTGWRQFAWLICQAAVVVAVGRIAYASLQWASRLYVLTNRRVMCFRGVLSVSAVACRLNRISDVAVQARWYEAMLWLGSIRMTPASAEEPVVTWAHLARPAEMHELLTRAIRKSQG